MAEFYDQPIFAARRLVQKAGSPFIMWELLTADGAGLGYIQVTRQPFGVRVMQALHRKASYPLQLEVYNQKEQLLLRIERIFMTSGMQMIVKGDKGQILGAVARTSIKGSVEKGSYEFKVIDAEKILIGMLRGNWRGNMLQLADEKGNIIGKINRQSDSVNRAVFHIGQRFHMVHVYFPPKAVPRRLVLLGLAAAIDILLGS